jgi:hypothetical protein
VCVCVVCCPSLTSQRCCHYSVSYRFPPVEFSPTHFPPPDLDFSLTDFWFSHPYHPRKSFPVAFSTLSRIRFFITFTHSTNKSQVSWDLKFFSRKTKLGDRGSGPTLTVLVNFQTLSTDPRSVDKVWSWLILIVCF